MKSGRAHKFSLLSLQNTISPNWSESEKNIWTKLSPLLLVFLAFFSFFLLFFPSFDFSFYLVTLAFCFLIFLSLVLSGRKWWVLLFLFFLFIFFFKKTLLDDFLCYFLKCSLSSIHNFLKKYNILFFVLFKRDMIVNLYKPYFQPNQKVFHPFTFPPFLPNINEEN